MANDLHSLPNGWRPEEAVRNNGPDGLALERYKLRELAEGWPMYRYANNNGTDVSLLTKLHVAMRANGKT